MKGGSVTPTKGASPTPKGAVQNGSSAENRVRTNRTKPEVRKTASPSPRPSSAKPGTASARAAMVSPPTLGPKRKTPEPPSDKPSPAPSYTPRNKAFRPKPRPPKQKAPEPPTVPSMNTPAKPKITAKKSTSPKKDTTPTRNVIRPPPKSFSVDPLDIARNYPLQVPKTSRSSTLISSTNIDDTAPPPLASPGM